jgi:sialate O-acetylesterase
MKVKFLLLGVLFSFLSGQAQIKLPGIFGDHMVLQRDQPVAVWGWSSPGEKLTLTFHQQIKETHADKTGKWRITLDSEPAGGPYELSLKGSNSLLLRDIMVGEVWICSGQSNMEFSLKLAKNAAAEIKEADYPGIRHIKIPNRVSEMPEDDISPARWETCSPSTAGNFTAVGYFFARELVKRLHVAVGLVNSSWGGTMVETWTSRGAFQNSPEFNAMIASVPAEDLRPLVEKRHQLLLDQIKLLQKDINDTLPEYDWKNPGYNASGWPKISVARIWENQNLGLKELDGVVWYRREVVLGSQDTEKSFLLSLGKIDDNDSTFVNGSLVGVTRNYAENRQYTVAPGIFKSGNNIIAVRVEDTGGGGGFYDDSAGVYLKAGEKPISLADGWHFRIAAYLNMGPGFGPNDYPCLLFNAMIHPLIPFTIRGALWYQGEANAERAHQYRMAFPLMITDWRSQWGEGNFPFYFVQLASWNADHGNSERGSAWAELREAQTMTLHLPATGMSVTTDIGESGDIHPKNKQDVGWRLAAIALHHVYGQNIEYSGPVLDSVQRVGNRMVLGFTHDGSGLMTPDKYGYVRGFEISGVDRQFHYAKAFIEHNKVVVYSEAVKEPISVRYNWADDAGDGNLFNGAGFPAPPFRTDQWPGITDEKKFAVNP